MQAAFHNAGRRLAAEPARALGLELKRFTLGHLFLLEELDCAFLPESGGDPTLDDLTTAVFVCAQEQSQAARNFRRWWTPLFFKFWGWRCRNMFFMAEALNFIFYLR